MGEKTVQKDAIFRIRKELKKNSHAVVRGHYAVFVFLMLVMIAFGTEFQSSISGWGKNPLTEEGEADDTVSGLGSVLEADDVSIDDSVLNYIMTNRLDQGEKVSAKISEEIVKAEQEGKHSAALGRTNGIFAQLVNAAASGKVLVFLAKSIRSVTHSGQAVAAIFIICSFLGYFLIFTFLKNVYSAILRRVYLQGRVYEKVSFLDVLHFAAVKKWASASLAMLVEYIFATLWKLTIVGWVIKYFSYWATPYIVAENPSLNGVQAVTLSRRMMNGHKFELFKFKVTLLGWNLLGIVTFGISDLLYGSPYMLACECEFYAKVREDALRRGVEGTELLNDPCLFEKADKILLYETYFQIVDEITNLHENRIVLSGWRKIIVDWFGIWLSSLKKKKAYDDQEGRAFALERYRLSMSGKAYPQWLNPLWPRNRRELRKPFTFLRSYTVWSLFLLFISFCFIGWTWEVALHFMQTGQFANRGTLHGPWLPIYGMGGLIVLILCARFRKKPVLEFITAILLCGTLEYFSAWQLETKYGVRWWSYDGYFLNLHGRVCAEGLLVFGVGCCAIVYLVAPLFDHLLSQIKQKVLIGLCAVIGVIYSSDALYSGQHPNMAEGAIEAETPAEGAGESLTEAITEALSEK